MNVIAINGSPRKDGNTANSINVVLEELHREGIDTEIINLAGQTIRGCQFCGTCFRTRDNTCAIENDIVNDIIEKIVKADAVILGSPTYFANITSEMKAVIDRIGSVAKTTEYSLYAKKVGAAVVVARREGGTNAFDAMNKFFLINQMIVPGSSSWNSGFGGLQPDEVQKDEEGLGTMKTLGQNMAWLMKKLY
jgi:multimeric flavodoxin WrbA